jgi:hypothetical protein
MNLKTAFFLACVLLGVSFGCKKTDSIEITPDLTDPASTTATGPTPTSVVGNWKITSFGLAPAWPKLINGKAIWYTDYMTFLKDINETCLSEVTFSFTTEGGFSSNMPSRPACSNGEGPNSRFVVEYLVSPSGRYSYVETADKLELRGTDNITHLTMDKTFGPRTVKLTWKLDRDMSDELVPTTYTLTLTKQ